MVFVNVIYFLLNLEGEDEDLGCEGICPREKLLQGRVRKEHAHQ